MANETNGNVGIQDLEELLDFGYTAYQAIADANSDGKINWLDLPKLMPVFVKAGAAIDGIKNIPKQLLDLDDQEQQRLIELTRRFYENISDAQAVVLIERTTNWVIDGVQNALDWVEYAKSK